MYRDSKALILGSGRSGQAADALLHSLGTTTVCLSAEATPDYQYETLPFEPAFAVVSPGFPIDHPWITDLQARGVRTVSEVEVGWSQFKGKVVAVTGSNGKSTVVKWIADALTRSGQPAIACGNYGYPVSAAVQLEEQPAWLVVEVSSFQLEQMSDFRPDIGLLLNVLPNHLDRHGDMATYTGLKMSLFDAMTPDDVAILPFGFIGNADVPLPSAPSIQTFGDESGADYQFAAGCVGELNFADTYFDNPILGLAAAAVAAVCTHAGVEASILEASAREFEPLAHRMQRLPEVDGVRFIDDSKATNLAGMCAALRMQSEPVHLIAGGRLKESDLSFAKDLLARQVKRLYLIGEASDKMQQAWGDSIECLPCDTLDRAVRFAFDSASSGETVLLSPACTSFDQFCSFNERGEIFAHEVSRLNRDQDGL